LTAEPVEVPAGHVETLTCDEFRALVELRGELDLVAVDAVRAELCGHVDAGRRVLRVDTSAVTFMDPTVLGALVEAHNRCQSVHGSLILTGVPDRLRRLLALAALDQVLLIDTASY
jgi:Anti-anti-sigma regulatory factor (antagonist of anti-sigma factor)